VVGQKISSTRTRILPHQLEDPAVADIGAIPEHLVIKHIVTAAEEIGPIAGFGNFEQGIVVAVMRAEPVHDGLEPVGVAVEQRMVAGAHGVVVHRDDEPEAAVDRTDAAHAGVVGLAIVNAHIGGDLAGRRRRV
jgi:hypothetical protein